MQRRRRDRMRKRGEGRLSRRNKGNFLGDGGAALSASVPPKTSRKYEFLISATSKQENVFFSLAGAPQPVPEVRHRFAGPHPVLLRAGGAAEPRPHGAGLPTRGEDAPKQAQAGHQVQAEEGEVKHRCPNVKGDWRPD